MTETNIEQFNRFTALIFAALYEGFPEPTFVTPEQTAGIEIDEQAPPWEWPKEATRFDDTIRWLRDAGYIWTGYDSFQLGASARLSPLGLECLQRTADEQADNSPTLGQRISEAVRDNAIDVAVKFTISALTAAGGAALS